MGDLRSGSVRGEILSLKTVYQDMMLRFTSLPKLRDLTKKVK